MTPTIVTVARIGAKHPVRERFAGCSTTGSRVGYYETKGHAVNAFDNVLQDYDLRFDREDCFDLAGDEGRVSLTVVDGCHNCVALAVLSWYRMPSGRYEFTGYLA